MTESAISGQINRIIDISIEKTVNLSKHLNLASMITLVLLVVSLSLSSISFFLMLPIFLVNGIPILVIYKLAKSMGYVVKLDSYRTEFVSLIENQDNIKENLKNSLHNTKDKTNFIELIKQAKVFLDVKKVLKERKLNVSSPVEFYKSISAISMLGNPLTLIVILICYLIT